MEKTGSQGFVCSPKYISKLLPEGKRDLLLRWLFVIIARYFWCAG